MLKGVYMSNDVISNSSNNSFFVETDQDDIIVPFLKIIQSLSDELIVGKDKYNPNVKAGDIYDSVTKTIFRNSTAIICGMKKYFAEWTPAVRGKLVNKHLPNSTIVTNAINEAKNKYSGSNYLFNLKTNTGNSLIESYGAVLILKNSNGVILPTRFVFSKSSFIIGKELNTMLTIYQNGGTPEFNLNTILTSNEKGSWYKPQFNFLGYVTDPKILNLATKLNAISDKIILK